MLRPSRLDYTFIGWYLNPEGTGAPINAIDGDELYDSTITVYAKWKKVSFTPILPTAVINLDSIEMMSANGSYIDGEGNVYLVEEDIEAYLNGTLTFYRKDDNLETV